MAGPLSPEHARALDAEDPLAAFRDRFAIDRDGPLYVDGNSLGRLPRETAARVERTVADWGTRLVTGWEDWIEMPERIGDLLAEHVLGARPGEVLACDSTTVNLFKLAGAVLQAAPGPVVAPAGDFPTDRYVLQGLAERHAVELRLVEPAALPAAARDARLVVLSHVDFRTGAVAELEALREGPALVLLDLSHSAGAIEVDLEASPVDLAVGCSYKYLNGGPGAPAWLYVRREHQRGLVSPVQGWFGQADQFAMGHDYSPVEGIGRFAAGTPPILAMAAVEAGLGLIAEAGMPAIARKTRALTQRFVALADAWLAPLGFGVASPRDAGARGGHVSLTHPEAWPVCRALIERAGVVPDFRAPDLIRFAFPALYTSFADVDEVARRTRDLVAAGEHRLVDARSRRVT